MKGVTTGGVSKIYQTRLLAKLSKISLENVNFDFFVKVLLFEELQAKSIDMKYTFQRKLFRAISWVRMV